VVTLLQAGRPGRAVVYVLASVVAGVAAAWTALR
jgi:fluoride ion exporter CrcB/FEX